MPWLKLMVLRVQSALRCYHRSAYTPAFARHIRNYAHIFVKSHMNPDFSQLSHFKMPFDARFHQGLFAEGDSQASGVEFKRSFLMERG